MQQVRGRNVSCIRQYVSYCVYRAITGVSHFAIDFMYIRHNMHVYAAASL